MGYTKMGDQCQTKIKNLQARYRKVKDENRKSGNRADLSFPYFDTIDAILGTRATSEPPVLLDSAVPETILQQVNAEGKRITLHKAEKDNKYVFSMMESYILHHKRMLMFHTHFPHALINMIPSNLHQLVPLHHSPV